MGYTVLNAGIAPLTIIPWIKHVSYVSDRDFVAIGRDWRSARTLVVRPSLSVKTLAQFVTYAKANPGKITIGSAGVGTVVGDASTVAGQVKAGKIVALAVAARQRSPALTDTPTMAQAGYPTVEAEGWHGLVVSSKTPPENVKRLRDALHVAQSDPAYQKRLKELGATTDEIGPAALQHLIQVDSAKWGAIIRSGNITMAE